MAKTSNQVQTFKKGDIVSIQYTDKGSPVVKTLDRAEVLACDGNHLKVEFRNIPAKNNEVDLVERSFDMSSPEFVGAQCIK